MNKDKPAIYIPYDPDGGCQAQGSGGYWLQNLVCSDGSTISESSYDNKEVALKLAEEKRKEHEAFLQLGPKERIRAILARYRVYQAPNSPDTRALFVAIAECLDVNLKD